jgi:hypothetical protein
MIAFGVLGLVFTYPLFKTLEGVKDPQMLDLSTVVIRRSTSLCLDSGIPAGMTGLGIVVYNRERSCVETYLDRPSGR